MAKTSKQRREQRKRARQRMTSEKLLTAEPNMTVTYITPYLSFADCQPAAATPQKKCGYKVSRGCEDVPTQKEETRENTMDTTARETRDYLLRRLERLFCSKQEDLRKKFDLYHSPFPKSPDQLVQMIKDGKFKIAKRHTDAQIIANAEDNGMEFADDAAKQEYLKDHFTYRSIYDYIEFDDGVKVDRKGYDEAEKVLRGEYAKARDAIVVLDAEKGLAALQAFEAL